MSPTVAPDISEHNPPVDDTFNRDWLTLRVCFGGGYTDLHAAHNLAWAVKARAAGKIKGFGVYVVYLPGENAGVLAQLDRLGVPADCVVMIDAENWGGAPYQINGDHSAEINDLADKLRARQSGRSELVWGYGNRGPDLEVWPNKPAWLGWVVASYGGTKPDVPNLIGWQYTDGQPEFDAPGRPHSTPPFGRCDHNFLYQLPDQGDTLSASDVQQILAAINAVPGKVWSQPVAGVDGNGKPVTWQAQTWLHYAGTQAEQAQIDPDKLAAGIAAQLPGVTEAQVAAAVKAAIQGAQIVVPS